MTTDLFVVLVAIGAAVSFSLGTLLFDWAKDPQQIEAPCQDLPVQVGHEPAWTLNPIQFLLPNSRSSAIQASKKDSVLESAGRS
jgi:hypothetical protein